MRNLHLLTTLLALHWAGGVLGVPPVILPPVPLPGEESSGEESGQTTPQFKVITWGQLADPEPVGDFDILAAATATVFVRNTSGEYIAWAGSNVVPPPISQITGAIQVVGGNYHVLALWANGTAAAFGSWWPGVPPLGIPPEWDAAMIQQIVSGTEHALALTGDGKVLPLGDGPAAQVPDTLGQVQILAAYADMSAAILFDTGGVVAWGDCSAGVCDVPEPAQSGVLQLALGQSHAVALKTDGTIVLWGDNTFHQLEAPQVIKDSLYPVVKVVAGARHTLALLSNGELVSWGFSTDALPLSQVPLAAQHGAITMVAGTFFSAALVPDDAQPVPPEESSEEESLEESSTTHPEESSAAEESSSSEASPEDSQAQPEASPIAPEASPIAPEASPIAPEPSPIAPEASPSVPESSPAAPEESSAVPESSPIAPEASPIAPGPSPAAPELSPVPGDSPVASPALPADSPAPPEASPAPAPPGESSSSDETSSGETSEVVPQPSPSPAPSPLPSPAPSPAPTPIPPAYPDFPYCNCNTPQRSPYSLDLIAKADVKKGIRYCFRITGQQRPAPCNSFDLNKIEFDIAPQCASVRDVLINGTRYPSSFASFNNGNNMVFKMTGGGTPLLNFQALLASGEKGAVMCFTLLPTCPLSTFCNGDVCKVAFFNNDRKCCPTNGIPSDGVPNAPPFTENFPWCPCDNTVASPYSLQLASRTEQPNNQHTVCYDLTTTAQTDSVSCGQMDLRKIEWHIAAGCRGSVKSATFDGVPLTPSYATYNLNQLGKGAGWGSLYKLINNTHNGNPLQNSFRPLARFGDLVGRTVPVCLTLRGRCNTLESFCDGGVCQIAYFSPSMDCCPVQLQVGKPIPTAL